MADFAKFLNKVLANEGGYVNDPDDAGGETYKGVSRVIWGNKYPFLWKAIDDMKKVPGFPQNLDADEKIHTMVRMFYKDEFWNPIDGDNIKNDDVALSIGDFAVNAGVGTSKELARIACDLPKYSAAGINLIEYNYFMMAFTLAKIARYIHICLKKVNNKKFFFGWIRRAMDVKFKNA